MSYATRRLWTRRLVRTGSVLSQLHKKLWVQCIAAICAFTVFVFALVTGMNSVVHDRVVTPEYVKNALKNDKNFVRQCVSEKMDFWTSRGELVKESIIKAAIVACRNRADPEEIAAQRRLAEELRGK